MESTNFRNIDSPLTTNRFRNLFSNPSVFQEHIRNSLAIRFKDYGGWPPELVTSPRASAVIFLLGLDQHGKKNQMTPYLILNKRSPRVKQAGDLCCPGGRIMPVIDKVLASFLTLSAIRANVSGKTRIKDLFCEDNTRLRTILSTALREAWEEMRLNPFKVKYLGPLQMYHLKVFKRYIFPVAGWVSPPFKFRPNWEVEKLIYIPLKSLLDPGLYARFKLPGHPSASSSVTGIEHIFPCFVHQENGREEILWGATYWITMNFLKWVFNFEPPEEHALPFVHKNFDEGYYTI